jgi:hypothetical protein
MRPNARRASYRGAVALDAFSALFRAVEGLAGRSQQLDAGRVIDIKFSDDPVPQSLTVLAKRPRRLRAGGRRFRVGSDGIGDDVERWF